MKYVKMLGLLAVAAAALMAFTGTAFGALATSPTGTLYTSTVKAESIGATSLHANSTVTCQKSTVEGKIESHGKSGSTTLPVSGKISKLTFGECGTDHVTVLSTGSLSVTSTGTLTSNAADITITLTNSPLGHLSCRYKTANTHIGRLTDSHETGGHAVLDIENSIIPREGHSFFCGSSGEWTGKYTVTTPTRLYID